MKPSICLNMIVRDEAHVVTETLDTVAQYLDYWVIVDTGSTDDTIELVRAYFMRKGIPGEVHERPWRNFGVNRSEALALAAGKADYTWVIDADDLVVGTLDLARLEADSYQLRYGGGSVYWRRQLFRSSLPWRYEGVVHEWPACEEATTEERLEGDYHVECRHLGARSVNPRKYERDAQLLLAEHERDPHDPRTVFYLGQSWYSAGEPARALVWYERRAAMGGFAEEVFYSLLRRGLCLQWLERPLGEVADAFLECWQSRPWRAEPLCELAKAYRNAGKFDLAYMVARQASEIPLPVDDALFVDADVYHWRSRDERSIAAYYVGRLEESYDVCAELLEDGMLPESERERVASNLGFAARRLPPERTGRPYRVKLMGNFWPTPQALCEQWERQSRGGGRWDDVEVVGDDDVDAYALVNFPATYGEGFDPARTFVFQMEPSVVCAEWGEWAEPDPRVFAQVRSRPRFRNIAEWHLSWTWEQLKTRAIEKTRVLSSVTSSRYWLSGHQLRVELLKHLDRSGVEIDVYGHDNAHGLSCYRGQLPAFCKDDGIFPYRYTFAAESSWEPNYFTEKIVDAILGECLCFYWGCPNLEEYLPADAFVRVPIEEPEQAREIIERAIADGEWERRLPAIREAKRRILDELQFFPTLAQLVHGRAMLDRLDVRVINLDRRADRWDAFLQRTEAAAGSTFVGRCERVSAVDARTLEPTPELERLFRENSFGTRRGVAAVALSHLRLWREVAAGARDCLILEDDVRLVHGFPGELLEICGQLREGHRGFDQALLGYQVWTPERERERTSDAVRRVVPMTWGDYLGGLHAYIVSPAGAARLVELVERDGIRQPLDEFLVHHRDELHAVQCTPQIAFAPFAVSYGSGVDSDIQYDFAPVGDGSPIASPDVLGWDGGTSDLAKIRGEVALKSMLPSLELAEIRLVLDPPWPASSPTVAADGVGLRMILASSSYRRENGTRVLRANEDELRTLNYVVRLDERLAIVDARPLLEDAAGEVRPGFEDCRLLRLDRGWFASAILPGAGDVLLRLDDDEIAEVMPLPNGVAGAAPFVADGRLNFLVGCAPTRVVSVDTAGIVEVSEREAPCRAAQLRPSSQGLALDDGLLFVVREEVPGDGITRFAHRFVRLDRELRLADASPRFRLRDDGREHCSGLARLGRALVLSFGNDDEGAALAVVDADEALGLLTPL